MRDDERNEKIGTQVLCVKHGRMRCEVCRRKCPSSLVVFCYLFYKLHFAIEALSTRDSYWDNWRKERRVRVKVALIVMGRCCLSDHVETLPSLSSISCATHPCINLTISDNQAYVSACTEVTDSCSGSWLSLLNMIAVES